MRKILCLLAAAVLAVGFSVSADAAETAPVLPEIPTDPSAETVHICQFVQISDTATCVQDGEKVFSCSCGEQIVESSPATGSHSFGPCTALDGQAHHKVCSVCGCSVEEPHAYGQWSSDSQGHIRSCSGCGSQETENHDWQSSVILQKPTCKEEGISGSVCSGCDFILKDTIAKLTVHTYDNACDAQCNVCGKTRTVQHTVAKTWTRDVNGHWHACETCDEEIEYAKHTPGPEATEEKEQLCTVCNYVIQPKKTHVHSYEKKWTTDEAGHWHACKTCDAEEKFEAHSFDDDCDEKCNVCDYKREGTHQYDDQWQNTAREHWQLCTLCGEKTSKEKHIPGPEATEQEPQCCTVCGYELEPAQRHSHDFGTVYVGTQENHWQECDCGEQSVPEPHLWDSGVKQGKDKVVFTCTLCGVEKTERDASSGFSWGLFFLILLALICLGGIVVLVIALRRENDLEEADPDQQEKGTEDDRLLFEGPQDQDWQEGDLQ